MSDKRGVMTLSRRVLRRGVNSPIRSPRRNNTSLRKKALLRQLSGDVQFGTDSKANLKVVVRTRPFNQRERDNNARCILNVVDEHMLVFDPQQDDDQFFFKGVLQRNRDFSKRKPKEQKFAFERVFTTESTNEDIYNATTHGLLDTLLSGYNCSVFAYGATGAGKTFTMLGTEDCPGITFLTLMELYKRIDNIREETTCEVAVSYLEVYNETVHDLLMTGGKALNLQESGQQVMVPGLTLHKPGDAQELMEILARGNQNRSQHPTDSNAESSRSHAVFQVFVKQRERVLDSLKSNVILSKLSMIDLAGSERGAATDFKGARFREGASINKSLLALGNCINALADGLRHIPYRDSKLTRLLKDSLGGNCRSIMIAAVSPASTTYEDTFNTLRYANRAKTIKTTIKKNMLNVDQHVSNYVKIVEELREQVCSLKAKIKTYEEKQEEWEKGWAAPSTSTAATPPPEFTLQQKQDLEARVADLEIQLKTRSVEEGEHRVPKEEVEVVEQQVEETIREHKTLRCELLKQESCQREIEFKMNGCTARLNRMKVLSFASQKLDKSIARCERTIRNLANRLAHVTQYKEEVQTKLAASVVQLQQMQNSSLSKQHIDKMEANLAVRDYYQHCLYLGRLVGEAFAEQSSSEQLISQLLHATRQFYVQLNVYDQCTPTFTGIFENVVENLNESKIAWADQQGDGSSQREETSASTSTVVDVMPQLDVKYFTHLPISPTVTISPAVSQERPRMFRKSSMKSSKISPNLPQLPTKCLASAHDPRSATHSLHSPLHEEEELGQCQTSTTCTSPVTSVSMHIVPTLPVLSTSKSVMEQLDDRLLVTENLPQFPAIANHLPVLTAMVNNNTSPHLPSEATYLGLSSSSQQCGTTGVNAGVEAMNTTELLEDIQPVDCSMNGTFSVTPAKGFNTTIDLSCPSNVLTHDVLPGASTSHEPTLSSSTVLPQTKEESDASLFVSLTKHCGLRAVNTTHDMTCATELQEDVKPVECSMNSTFSITPAKMLNTTIDLPSYLNKQSKKIVSGATTSTQSPTLRTLSILSLKPDVTSVPQLSSVHNLTITKPESYISQLPDTVTSQGTSCELLNIPSQCAKRFRSASDGAQDAESVDQIALDPASNAMCHSSQDQESTKTASRKLFQPFQPSLDSTFSVSDDLTGIEHTPGITMVKSVAPERAGSLEVQSSGASEVQQRSPLQSVPDRNDKAALQGSTIVVTTTAGGTAMPPPTKFNKMAKRGLSHTPYKLGSQTTTPGKMVGARTTPTHARGLGGSMRRSVSTPSLASPLPSTYTTNNPKPWRRKFSGLGGMSHRSSSNLKSVLPIANQENVPPSSTRKNALQSSVHRNTVASTARYTLNVNKQ